MTTSFTHVLDLAQQVVPPQSGMVNQVVFQDEQIKAVVFSFAAGAELAQHKAPKAAMLFFVSGEATVGLGEEKKSAQVGTWVHMPAGLVHSIQAKTAAVMLLVLLK